MEEYLKSIVSPLLSEPEALQIQKSQDEMGVLLSVNVSKKDMGLIIGKNGDTIKAVRTIVHMFGAKNKAKVSVKVNEPNA